MRTTLGHVASAIWMAPGSRGTLYVSIPGPDAAVIVLLDRDGRPRPGWPVTLEGSTWVVAASTGEARSGHTASLLLNGTVLVAGGTGLGSEPELLRSAELYDPKSGSWTATASKANARFRFTATLLRDGRVLVAGDYDYESQASAESYVPGS